MKSRIVSLLSILLFVSMSLLGCGDGAGETPDPGSNSGTEGEDEPFVSLCESTPDIDTWSQTAITRTGENYSLQLTAISPEPWSVGDNDWRIAVTGSAGESVDGVSLFVTPYMPDHGHGVSPPLYNGVLADDGVFDVETFNLIMPGFWEMTVTVRSSDLPDEAIAFRICVES